MRKETHDLDLPDIGPYSTRFLGAAQIADRKKGQLICYPLSISLEGGKQVRAESSERPINALPEDANVYHWTLTAADEDLNGFTQRYLLKGRDEVFADAEYLRLDQDSFLCALNCVNSSASPQIFNAEFSFLHEWEAPRVECRYPKGTMVIHAHEYSRLTSHVRYSTDGERPGVRQMLFTSQGKALEGRFGEWPGDAVEYEVLVRKNMKNAVLYLRYCKVFDNRQRFRLSVNGLHREISFSKTTERLGSFSGWNYLEIPLGVLPKGRHTLCLEVMDPQNRFCEKQYKRNLYGFPVDEDFQKRTEFGLDFILISEGQQNTDGWVVRMPEQKNFLEHRVKKNSVQVLDKRLSGKNRFMLGTGCSGAGFKPFSEQYIIKEVTEHHVRRPLPAETDTPLEDIVVAEGIKMRLPALRVKPGAVHRVFVILARGKSAAAVEAKWTSYLRNAGNLYEKKRKRLASGLFNPHDGRYGPSVRHLAAYLLGNVSFPYQVRNKNVLSVCPSKFVFTMLYTWDAGMTALGQVEFAEKRAKESIGQYLIDSDPEQGYIQHGTGLPTQIYAIWELFQKTGNRKLLCDFYSRARNAYRYYAGTHPASTSLRNGNGLINTSNIWYNALGMDDYPVQKICAEDNLLSHAGMPESNASAIRFAKIMRLMAHLLGRKRDIPEYEKDMRTLGKALAGLWDGKSGYYSWTDRGQPILFGKGVNYNMGISGVYPLVSGLDDLAIREGLVGHIMTEGEMWSPIGISTVDQSAPYYSPDGYWNGRVWIAHQWMIWKSMLDCGEIGHAEKIAMTALKLYSDVERQTGQCFENFIIKSRSGGGTMHFGALSAPVVNFYCAYFTPGRVSTGFDVYVARRTDDKQGLPMTLKLESPFAGKHETGLVLVLQPDTDYLIDGRRCKSCSSGSLSLSFQIDKHKRLTILPARGNRPGQKQKGPAR